jgi:hypothetical protein
VTKQKNKKEKKDESKKDDSKKDDGKKDGQDKEKSLGDQQTAADPATPPKSEVDSSQVSPQKDSPSSSSSSDNSPIKYVITIDPETEEVTVHTEPISEEEHAERERAQNEKVKKKPTCQSHPGRVHYNVSYFPPSIVTDIVTMQRRNGPVARNRDPARDVSSEINTKHMTRTVWVVSRTNGNFTRLRGLCAAHGWPLPWTARWVSP